MAAIAVARAAGGMPSCIATCCVPYLLNLTSLMEMQESKLNFLARIRWEWLQQSRREVAGVATAPAPSRSQ
jgi:hypothetical protein